jgi:hypothetical protein
MIGLSTPLDSPTCSRAGCRDDAIWRLDWRNPRIHSADRTKTWLACAEHVDYLRDFLATRDFPLSVSLLVDDASDESSLDQTADSVTTPILPHPTESAASLSPAADAR